MQWTKVKINTGLTIQEEAIAPEVISASRATDIPAFHGSWFIEALRRGYCIWTNPFNSKQKQYVSFANVKAIVFWSKNPEPFLRYLPEIDQMGIKYYFQYTINDYKVENFEPNIPPLKERMQTFMKLSHKLGKDCVIWRFDPLILTDGLTVDKLIKKIKNIGDILHKHTSKFVFSFVDIEKYRKVKHSLKRENVNYREWQESDMIEAAEKIANLCTEWGIKAATCGEHYNLTRFGIQKNKCIDNELLLAITDNSPELLRLYDKAKYVRQILFDEFLIDKEILLKDQGQRNECRCVPSKDIGMYDTCSHFCVYCYANTSPGAVKKNIERLGLLP